MNFDYEAETVSNVTKENLQTWIAELYTQLCDIGIITDLDTETHQQIAIIAKSV